jgi:hypothetical protein
MVNSYEQYCGKFDDYSLQYTKYFVEACEAEGHNEDDLIGKIKISCGH